ncbi:MAG: hypothetical protein M9962_07600 [Oligoflexia bacterium]|nr:hypothetical protein [Oligoflexia bacterium]
MFRWAQIFAFFAITLFGFNSYANFTIQNYNESLPIWGTTWKPGSDSVNGYYPSFYTGFAIRSASAERIHIKTARGNQTRVSIIVDDTNMKDYIFDLSKRYTFYKKAEQAGLINTKPKNASLTPHLEYFNKIIESNDYGILSFVSSTAANNEVLNYKKSLEVLEKLNPGRVFKLNIDLSQEFLKWKSYIRANLAKDTNTNTYFTSNPDKAVTALSNILFGRITVEKKPSDATLKQLAYASQLALQSDDNEVFVQEMAKLLTLVSGNKFNFKTLNAYDQFVSPIQCNSVSNCWLSYIEFTAIYPTGSVKASTKDKFGNSIPTFATPGLWQFLSRSSHEVDNIRSEPYYGWIPKMDFEAAGNGFHNPAVRFYGVSSSVKSSLNIDSSHNTLWTVKRGGVSHGCLRLPVGHAWELRNMFPVANEDMTKIFFYGSNPKDFDLYDIDGDGSLELIGVEYLVSYGLQGDSGLPSREGSDLKISKEDKLNFYKNLYGSRGVFELNSSNQYIFSNPSVSLPSYLDFKKKSISSRVEIKGEYALYEMPYEQDKVQFYAPYTTAGLTVKGSSPLSKRIVRLMGRVRGCSPTTNKDICGESAFDKEMNSLLREVR